MNINSSVLLSKYIKAYTLKMVSNAKASHVGGGLSISDILAVLYNNILYFDSQKPLTENRDRFILSKGHCCAALYATLALKNFFTLRDLNSFAQFGSNFMSHASHKVKGVEFSTGSLGHGLPYAVGKAVAAKSRNKKWEVFVLLSDGELNEGSNWEATLFASHHNLNNLTIIVDYNKLQSLTTVEKTIKIEPLKDKFEAFGCYVSEVNGHDHEELKSSLSKTNKKNSPKVIIAHTVKGKGVSFMENRIEWHYKSPDEDQLKMALNEIGVML